MDMPLGFHLTERKISQLHFSPMGEFMKKICTLAFMGIGFLIKGFFLVIGAMIVAIIKSIE